MDFFEKLKRYEIILGSQSPRRQELLAQTGIPFRKLVRETSEVFPVGLPPEEVVLLLCQEKAKLFEKELQDPAVVVITADTMVAVDQSVMNKPADPTEAFDMLKTLSGRWHEVLTGVCIRQRNKEIAFFETTKVLFRELEDWEILHYINDCQPFDKAGAYGIQEWIGIVGIREIRGSYANVVGLPVERLFCELKNLLESPAGSYV